MHAPNNIRFFATNARNRRIEARKTAEANAKLAEIIAYTNSVLAKNMRPKTSKAVPLNMRPKTSRPLRRNSKYVHPHDKEMATLMKEILGPSKRR